MKYSVCVVLLAVSLTMAAPREPVPVDTGVAQLAKEVRAKGWIAYSAVTEKGDWDVFVMRPDGSHRRNLTNTPDWHDIGPRFSPDGKQVLYRRISLQSKIRHDHWGAIGSLIIARSDGSNPVEQGPDGELPWASWSPDGKQIACLTKGGIEIRDLATKKLLRKMDRKGIYQQFFWSPDGQWFTGPANTYGENWTVVRMSASTGDVNPVVKFQNCTADWFPDSRRLIFSSRPAHQDEPDGGETARSVGQKPGYGWTQLWMAEADGSSKSLLYGEDGRHIYGGAVSPDGKYVLFTRSPVDGIGKDQKGAPMGLMRLRDAPVIAGESPALRKLHPKVNAGPVLPLPDGWEPHWTYAQITVK